jgi:hypothetical protein
MEEIVSILGDVEKAKEKKILSFHLTDEALFLTVQGTSPHGVQIWFDGRFLCSCSHHIYRRAYCSHIIAGLLMLGVLLGEEKLKEVVRNALKEGSK